jgi:hypothetical protein
VSISKSLISLWTAPKNLVVNFILVFSSRPNKKFVEDLYPFLNPKFRSRRDPFLIGRGLAVARPDWSTNGDEKLFVKKRGESKVRIQTVPPKTGRQQCIQGNCLKQNKTNPNKTGRRQCIQGKKTIKYSADFSTLTKRLEK